MTMKRSTTIGLGAAGIVLAASAWSLLGGEDDKLVYEDTRACRADGKLTDDQCDQRWREAREAHARNAKRFPNQKACESEFGNGRCDGITVNGAPMWVPALVGFAIARRFAAGGGGAEPLLPPDRVVCPPGSTDPGCRSSSGSGGSGSGSSGYGSGSGKKYSTTDGGHVTTSPVSRGGFGSTGRGVSSGS
jgi:uncharacterized protein YgiB involved in biofilm formation